MTVVFASHPCAIRALFVVWVNHLGVKGVGVQAGEALIAMVQTDRATDVATMEV